MHNGTLYIGPSEYFPKTHRGLTNTNVTPPTFLPLQLICMAEQISPLPDGAIPFPLFPTPGPASFQLAALSNPSSLCESRTYIKLMPIPSTLNMILCRLGSRSFTSKQRCPSPSIYSLQRHTYNIQPSSHHPTSISKPKPKYTHNLIKNPILSKPNTFLPPHLTHSPPPTQPAVPHSPHLPSHHQAFPSSHITSP